MDCANCMYSHLLWKKGEKYTSYFSFDESYDCERPATNYECRRYAPRGMIALPENAYGVENFPTMQEGDWCGEFVKRDAP